MKNYLIGAVAIFLTTTSAQAGCPKFEEIDAIVAAYQAKLPIKPIENLRTILEAYCAQGKLAAQIGRIKGAQAGFKAGYTSLSTRSGTDVDRPLRGFLFQNMFLKDGSVISANFGARPRYAADLIAVAKDDDLNMAVTSLDALAHISHFLPFIDLSDLIVEEGAPTDMYNLIATNIGSRWGVLGKPIPVEVTEDFLARLAAMTIVMEDEKGEIIGRGKGSDVLGHPMNSVLWIVRDLAHSAQRVQQGDKLGVGAFIPAGTPQAGRGVKVTYQGLPGDPSVSVRFE
jgi:2-keto-4-pentenoate hydratase